MTGGDREVTRELRTLLGIYMKHSEADAITIKLRDIICHREDGPELVRLFQKWIAVI